MALTDKRLVFIEEYLRCWNGSEAARRAGYAYPGREAYRLLKIAEIREEIQQRIKDKAMDADEILGHLADIARFDAGLLLGETGDLDLKHAREKGYTRFVKKVQWTAEGVKIELYDRADALEKLGKHLEIWGSDEKDFDITLRVTYGDD